MLAFDDITLARSLATAIEKYLKAYGGFESHSLRQIVLISFQFLVIL